MGKELKEDVSYLLKKDNLITICLVLALFPRHELASKTLWSQHSIQGDAA